MSYNPLPPGGFHGPYWLANSGSGFNPGPGPMGNAAFNPGPGPMGNGAFNPGPWSQGYSAGAHPPPATGGNHPPPYSWGDAQFHPPPRGGGHSEQHPPPQRWQGVDPAWVYGGAAESLLATALRKTSAKLNPSVDPRQAKPAPGTQPPVQKQALATAEPLWRWDPQYRMQALLTQLHGRSHIQDKTLWLIDGQHTSGQLTASKLLTIEPPMPEFDYGLQIEGVIRAAAEREDRLPEILSQADDVLPFFDVISGVNRLASPLLCEFLALAWQWETQLVMELKNEIAEQRPYVRSALVQPVIATPGHGSLPSGHATLSALLAVLFGALCTERYEADEAAVRVQRLDALARRIAFNRVVAGVHFQMDSLAGYRFGTSLGHVLLALAGHGSKEVQTGVVHAVNETDVLAEGSAQPPRLKSTSVVIKQGLPQVKLLWEAVLRELRQQLCGKAMAIRWNQTPQLTPSAQGEGDSSAPSDKPGPRPKPSSKAPPEPSDPYVRWAKLSGWRGYRCKGGPNGINDDTLIKVLVRAPTPEKRDAAMAIEGIELPPLYQAPHRNGRCLSFTARYPLGQLVHLDRLGLRWEMAVPLRDALDAESTGCSSHFGDDLDLSKLPEPANLGGPVGAGLTTSADHGNAMKSGEPNAELIDDAIAVIDFGCAFLNSSFAHSDTPGDTRVKALWVQSAPTGPMRAPPWIKPALSNYGSALDAQTLRRLCADFWARRTTSAPDERDVYRQLGYLIDEDDPQRRIWFATHGTHVLSVAAGHTDPLTGLSDKASQANLIFVQLPALTAADGSGSSLGAYLLDAVQFALQSCKPKARLVINISYGSFAGPHDGHSLIEEALDELLELHKGRLAIVLAAGNARQMQCHARRQVGKGLPARLYLQLSEGDPTDTFVELWYRRPKADAGRLRVRLRTPTGYTGPWARLGSPVGLKDEASNTVLAAAFVLDRPSNGKANSLLLLCLGPTQAPRQDGLPTLPAGVWELEVALDSDSGKEPESSITFDAWVERDDPSGMSNAEQPHFLGLCLSDAEESLSSIATGQHTLAVSGFRLSDGHVAPYASSGTRIKGSVPLVYAVCEEDALQPTIRAAAVRSDERFRMNGTSVAAPALARRVFNHRWPNAASLDWSTELSKIVDANPEQLKR